MILEPSLDEILVTPLKQIDTPGGDIFHGIKAMDAGFSGFGEVYFSWINFQAVKAWKQHRRMTMNLIVPVGNVRFAFYQESEDIFRTETIGQDNYCRLTVPPKIWFGFSGVFMPKSLVTNVANLSHDPHEVLRKDLNDISYLW